MRRSASLLLVAAAALLAGLWSGCSGGPPPLEPQRFWLGNTHTHTLWSDGNAAPEWVVAWYRERDYDFLALTDHNVLAVGDAWRAVGEGERVSPAHLADLEQKFGADAVETRDTADGGREMRLRTLEELRARFEDPGDFLMITGEEITDGFEGANVHVNALNLAEVIPPQRGETLTGTVQRNVDAVAAQALETGRPLTSHLNHPNFTWSFTWPDFATVRGLRHFEVYNGHPGVRNSGDAEHLSTESMWDQVNTARLREHGLPLMFGVATDDAHHYHAMRVGRSNPGRGWIRVAAAELSAESLLAALDAGDFYASSGVELEAFAADAGGIRLRIQAEEGVRYTTDFVGTRGDEIGVVLATVEGPEAAYAMQGDEWFVRARVTSDRPHPNPSEEGEFERAWLQPVRGPAAPPAP